MSSEKISNSQIYREQVSSLCRKLPLWLLTQFFVGSALILFVMTVPRQYSLLAFAWYGALALVCLTGIFVARYFKSLAGSKNNLAFRSNLILFLFTISGVVWGCTWLITPDATGLDAPRGALLMAPCILVAFAAANYSDRRRVFFAFSIPAIFLNTLFSLLRGTEQQLEVAGGLNFYLLLSSLLAYLVYKDRLQGLMAKLDVSRLQQQLATDKEILEQKEEQLLEKIVRERSLLEEKNRTSEKLEQATEEKLLLLDAVSEGIIGVNKAGKITFINSIALKLLDYDELEVVGNQALSLLSRSKTDFGKEAVTRKALAECFDKGNSVQRLQGVFSGRDDLVIPVSFSCKPIRKKNTLIGTVINFTDMTTQLEMETKMIQSQKMEAIGRITGGVAHDFNNLLTIIMGNLQFLNRRYLGEAEPGATALIDKVMVAARSGAELNNRLLSYSREQALESALEDINLILSDMQDFLKRALGEEIQIEFTLSAAPAFVNIDRTQFENVMINLCLNARDAMPAGGTLYISTSHTKLDESPTLVGVSEEKRPEAANDNNVDKNEHGYVELSVRDTGIGIPESLQQKVFDPFFTTKEKGKGSGFGLSTAFGFLQQSGGNIAVKSQVGKGSTFTLHLPLVQSDSIGGEAEAESKIEPEKYNGTILVVEDDAGVRDVATQTLLDSGFKVISAQDGQSGLREFGKHIDIDLVFSDIVMPGGMTGVELAQKILEERRIPILLATGYTEKLLKDRLVGMEDIICIPKPYDTDELPRLINSMLNREAC